MGGGLGRSRLLGCRLWIRSCGRGFRGGGFSVIDRGDSREWMEIIAGLGERIAMPGGDTGWC